MKKVALLTGVIISAYFIYQYIKTDSHSTAVSEPINHDNDQVAKASPSITQKKQQTSTPLQNNNNSTTQKPNKPQASAEQITAMIFDSYLKNPSPDKLIQRLKDMGLEPIVDKEGDEDSGEAYIIRTKNSIPGTRSFHAQYEPDGQGGATIQHLSLEFPPGQMPKAVSMVEQFAGQTITPITSSPDFMRWSAANGNHVWLKVLDKEFLKDTEVFQARSDKDIGTVRMVIEYDHHPPTEGNNGLQEEDEADNGEVDMDEGV